MNLISNPGYIHLSGNWQFTINNGETLRLGGFTPSVGFPTAQISSLQSVGPDSVLCIENLTTFHQYIRRREQGDRCNAICNLSSRSEAQRMPYALICTCGNPFPAIPRARPLTVSDHTNLGRLLLHSTLRDVRAIIEHLLQRGLKLEQKGVEHF